MKLKETITELVGFFKCTIDDTTVIISGIENTILNDQEEPIADLLRFDVLDLETFTIPRSVLAVSNQVGDKILFLYKKDKYELISITNDLVTLQKDGTKYFIERIELPTRQKKS